MIATALAILYTKFVYFLSFYKLFNGFTRSSQAIESIFGWLRDDYIWLDSIEWRGERMRVRRINWTSEWMNEWCCSIRTPPATATYPVFVLLLIASPFHILDFGDSPELRRFFRNSYCVLTKIKCNSLKHKLWLWYHCRKLFLWPLAAKWFEKKSKLLKVFKGIAATAIISRI